jgi:hypothetical protein
VIEEEKELSIKEKLPIEAFDEPLIASNIEDTYFVQLPDNIFDKEEKSTIVSIPNQFQIESTSNTTGFQPLTGSQ